MSKTVWNATINFYSTDDKIIIQNLPVVSFQVRGGAMRTIHLNAAKSTDIVLELDDARDHKNLQIFIPPSKGIAVAQLGEAYLLKKQMTMDFFLESKKGRTWIQAFNLYSGNALVLRHPVAVQKNETRALKIEMSLTDPRLEEMSPKSKYVMGSKAI